MSERIRVSDQWSELEEQIVRQLKSYRTLVLQHRSLEELRDMMCPSITVTIRDMPGGGSVSNSAEDRMMALIEVRDQLARTMQCMTDRIDEISGMIGTLPADEHTVMLRRYMLGESMEVVSGNLYMSLRKCWVIHRRAVRRLAENVHGNAR